MRFNHDGAIGEIDNLPGSSQVAVLHSVFVPPDKRNMGLGSHSHKMRLTEASNLGYNYVMCTVSESNIAQIKILKQHGWKQLDSFISDKTTNKVILFGKLLEGY